MYYNDRPAMTDRDALIGRETELKTTLELACSSARLVSIVGPVGVGKSRLLAAAGAELERTGLFECVARLELTDVETQTQLAAQLADAGVAEWCTTNAGCATALLVIDAAEITIPTLRAAIPTWLAASAGLTLILASRHRLDIGDERLVTLAAFPTSDGAFSGPAAELFVRAARRAEPNYEPTDAQLPALSALLKELDGLPLAIELFAPRATLMAPHALLHRLRQGATRGTSFERAVAGAWNSLTDDQQSVLQRLSWFPASFDFDAAAAALALSDEEATRTLQELKARSWLESSHLPAGEVRLSLLSSLRRFVAARTPAPVSNGASERIAAHFGAWCANRSQTELAQEQPNLDQVLASVLDSGPVSRRHAEPVLRILVALYFGFDQRPTVRHLQVLDPLLRNTRDSGADPLLICRALIAAGSAWRAAAESAYALRDLSHAASLAVTVDAPELIARAQCEISSVLLDQCEHDAARDQALSAIGHARRAQSTELEVIAHVRAGEALRCLGEDACALLERGVALAGKSPHPRPDNAATYQLALGHLDQGRVDEARSVVTDPERPVHAATRDLILAMIELDSGRQVGRTALLSLAERTLDADVLFHTDALALILFTAIRAGNLPEAHVHGRDLLRHPSCRGRQRELARLLLARVDQQVLLGANPEPISTPDAALIPLQRLVRATLTAGEAAEALRRGPASCWLRLAAGAVEAGAESQPTASVDALRVGREGRWFQLPGSDVVSLTRRKPLARLVAALADARQLAPNQPIERERLLGFGWPGQRLATEAGAHRVRVAISTLRKLGLAKALETRGSGYLISTEYDVTIDETEAA